MGTYILIIYNGLGYMAKFLGNDLQMCSTHSKVFELEYIWLWGGRQMLVVDNSDVARSD